MASLNSNLIGYYDIPVFEVILNANEHKDLDISASIKTDSTPLFIQAFPKIYGAWITLTVGFKNNKFYIGATNNYNTALTDTITCRVLDSEK